MKELKKLSEKLKKVEELIEKNNENIRRNYQIDKRLRKEKNSINIKAKKIIESMGFGYRDWETDRKSTRLNSSHSAKSRMPSSA